MTFVDHMMLDLRWQQGISFTVITFQTIPSLIGSKRSLSRENWWERTLQYQRGIKKEVFVNLVGNVGDMSATCRRHDQMSWVQTLAAMSFFDVSFYFYVRVWYVTSACRRRHAKCPVLSAKKTVSGHRTFPTKFVNQYPIQLVSLTAHSHLKGLTVKPFDSNLEKTLLCKMRSSQVLEKDTNSVKMYFNIVKTLQDFSMICCAKFGAHLRSMGGLLYLYFPKGMIMMHNSWDCSSS